MFISAPHGRLEAKFSETTENSRGVAVVCHPHPLHGGTMHTKAVFRAGQALGECGFHVLRFNFRGVGASTGSYGDGIDEMADVTSVLDWFEEEYPGLPALVAGFSFGSMVGLRVGVEDDRVRALIGLGMPVRLYDFGFLKGAGKPVHVIQGEEDEFGSGPEVQSAIDALDEGVTLDRIPGAGHFFHDHFDELKEAVRRYVTDGPAAALFPE